MVHSTTVSVSDCTVSNGRMFSAAKDWGRNPRISSLRMFGVSVAFHIKRTVNLSVTPGFKFQIPYRTESFLIYTTH
jgi:hypothetical protein